MSPTVTRMRPLQLQLCRDPFVWKLHLQIGEHDLYRVLMNFDQPRHSGNELGISRDTLARYFLSEVQIDMVESIINQNATEGVRAEFRTIICTQLPDTPAQHLFSVPIQEAS